MKWTFEYLKLKIETFHNSLQFQLKSFRDLVQASYSVFAQHLTVSTYYCMPYVWLDFPATSEKCIIIISMSEMIKLRHKEGMLPKTTMKAGDGDPDPPPTPNLMCSFPFFLAAYP